MYISETASVHLGLPQIDLTGSSIFEYVHPSDHNDIHEVLSLNELDRERLQSGARGGGPQNELARSFSMRMKCILPKRNAGLVSSGYKTIHCNGYLKAECKLAARQQQQQQQLVNSASQEPAGGAELSWESCALVAVGHSLLPSASTEVKLTASSFMFKANLDLRLYYVESP